MDLLFKIEEGQTNVGQSNFVEHYGNINYSMTWNKLLPSVKQATNLFIKPTLGNEFYNQLAKYYQSNESEDEFKNNLIDMLQDAIAYYTILLHSNTTGVNLSELGLINRTDKDGTVVNISQWQYRNIVWNLTKTGDSFFEMALAYIFDNQSKLEFKPEGEILLINSAKDLAKHINTKGSYRAYLSLKPFIKKATQIYIKPILGEDLLKHTLDKIKANDKNENHLKLLEKAQAVLAEYALNIAIPHLTIDLSQGYISLLSESDGLKKYETANDNKLEALEAQTKRFAEIQQQELLRFLAKNKEAFGIETTAKESIKVISSGGSVGLF